MKKLSLIVTAALSACSLTALASEVSITNKSNHTIPVKYQLAYHNPGQDVVLGKIKQGNVRLGQPITVNIDNHGFQHAGIVVIAVKKNQHAKVWHQLPSNVTKFDSSLGCWTSTSKTVTHGTISLDYKPGKPARINCQV